MARPTGSDASEHVPTSPAVSWPHPSEALVADLDLVLGARVHQPERARAGCRRARVREGRRRGTRRTGHRTAAPAAVLRSPSGGARTIASSRSSMPVPSLAETGTPERIESGRGRSLHHPLDVRRGQVDLVDDGHDREVEFHRQVGWRSKPPPLGGVDDQQRPVAAHERAPD